MRIWNFNFETRLWRSWLSICHFFQLVHLVKLSVAV